MRFTILNVGIANRTKVAYIESPDIGGQLATLLLIITLTLQTFRSNFCCRIYYGSVNLAC